jgi:hypothetical protein
MRFLKTTMCLTVALAACGKQTEEKKQPQKSAEEVAAEQGLSISQNDYLVMKIDRKTGATTMVKTTDEASSDLATLSAQEEALFASESAKVVSVVSDESELDASTESYHFDNDDIDCFKVKVKVKIEDDDGDTIRKMKEKYRVCENVGPTYRFGYNRVTYRPYNYFYNADRDCDYVRFRPAALNYWNGRGYRNYGFRAPRYGYGLGYGIGNRFGGCAASACGSRIDDCNLGCGIRFDDCDNDCGRRFDDCDRDCD